MPPATEAGSHAPPSPWDDLLEADVRAAARRWLSAGQGGVVVEVQRARGSVPREAGTRMLVGAADVVGTIGGGHLELQAIASARARLGRRGPGVDAQADTEHFPLGPRLGQCCGGAVTLAYRRLDASVLADWPEPAPRFHLQLYGAGHVGRAIVHALLGIPCRVEWIDEREEQFPVAPTPEVAGTRIERLCVEPVEAEVALAPAGAHYLVLTHSHDLDLRICEAILRRGDFTFLGLIGSRTKRERFLRRFAERGIAPERLARLTCPIGLPGIQGKEPAVIAAAVVAQLLGGTQQGQSRP